MTLHRLSTPGLVALLITLSITLSAQADLPALTGTVFHDADQDGLLTTDEGLMGVTVDLYADNGDGVFDVNVDEMLSTEITDVNGQYAFAGLGVVSNVFVHQAAQTVGSTPISASTAAVALGDFNLIIDDFADQQRVDANPIVNVGQTNLTSSTVIGGQRDLHVQYLDGPAEAALHANPYGLNEVLEFNQAAGVRAVATVTWDGIDADMSTTPDPNAPGLGGLNLTADGSIAFGFTLGVDAAGEGENLTLRIFSGADVSTASIGLPVTGGTATELQIVPFSEFVGDADLTDITAIQLELGGDKPSIDAQLGPIGLVGPSNTNIPVTIPEPSTCLIAAFAFLWVMGRRRAAHRRTR